MQGGMLEIQKGLLGVNERKLYRGNVGGTCSSVIVRNSLNTCLGLSPLTPPLFLLLIFYHLFVILFAVGLLLFDSLSVLLPFAGLLFLESFKLIYTDISIESRW